MGSMRKHDVEKPRFVVLQSEQLYDYILNTMVFPREHSLLKELRDVSASHPKYYFGTAADAGQLMTMLLKMMNAKKTIEIGVFTGYSLLLTALAIPDDGKITAIDIDREAYEIGLPIIKKAGVEHKINFVKSPALSVLDKLLEDKENERSYEFAFVDADKGNYKNYHERLMKLMKIGGVIIYDNTLWGGSVGSAEESVPEFLKKERQIMVDFNQIISADLRIDISLAPLGDGMTICRLIN